jgi:hypothetical protein
MTEPLSFKYSQLQNTRGETLLRPQLPIRLSYHGQSADAIGLVDSGADVNVLPYRLGLALGAIWDEQATALTLSGNLAQYEARGLLVMATIGNFAPVRLAFAWTRAENPPLLLGQVNFFAEFDICFSRSKLTFEITPK